MIDPLDPSTLEAARKAAGLSRADLASAAKCSETTILRIEKGGVDPRLDETWAPIVRAVRIAAARQPTSTAEAA
jgi:predicted transcriptional regulator